MPAGYDCNPPPVRNGQLVVNERQQRPVRDNQCARITGNTSQSWLQPQDCDIVPRKKRSFRHQDPAQHGEQVLHPTSPGSGRNKVPPEAVKRKGASETPEAQRPGKQEAAPEFRKQVAIQSAFSPNSSMASTSSVTQPSRLPATATPPRHRVSAQRLRLGSKV